MNAPVASTVRNYYGLLNVGRDATAEEIKRAYRKLARELHPDVNPDPQAQNRFKEVTTAYEVLSDPEKRRIVDLGGDPLAPAGGAGGNPFGAGFGGFGDIFETFFGGAAGGTRGPRSRVRQGADALLRIELSMAEMAFGVHKDIAVETAVTCQTCSGDGCAPGTRPRTCDTCGGRGEVQSMQRSLLGPVMTSRQCPTCGGTGQQIPSPCPNCSGEGRVRARRTIIGRRAGRHRGRHADPDDRPGRGRPRRRPARRPLHRGHRAAARDLHPRGFGPALHPGGADDRRGAGHRADPDRPGRRGAGRDPARHPVRSR